MYPVDMWLLEKDRTDSMESESFIKLLENAGMPKGIMVIDAWNDINMSYKNIANLLERMTKDLREVQQINEETPCTSAIVTSDQFLNFKTGGLQPAQYVCYDKANLQVNYLQCSTSDLASLEVTCVINESEAVINMIDMISNAVSSDYDGLGIIEIDGEIVLMDKNSYTFTARFS